MGWLSRIEREKQNEFLMKEINCFLEELLFRFPTQYLFQLFFYPWSHQKFDDQTNIQT